MYLFAEEFFQIDPGFDAYFFDSSSFMSDNNSFLACAFNHNYYTNADNILVFLKLFGYHLNGVRNLFVVIQQNFFPDNFINKKPLGFVRQTIFVEIRWRFGK